MKIDHAIKDFLEKYDSAAMRSIDTLSKDYGLNVHKSTIKLFNITEGFNTFNEYLKGYAEYKVKFLNDDKASPQSVIQESVSHVINDKIFQEKAILYSELPAFVESYVKGIEQLQKTIDVSKNIMMEADVPMECVGDVNTFVDMFMDKLNESFNSAMDRILWASGYNSHNILHGNKATSNTGNTAVFL